MAEIKIFDNAISKGYQNFLEETFTSLNFPWYMTDRISYFGDSGHGFWHSIYSGVADYSQFALATIPLLYEVCNKNYQVNHILRIRAGMFTRRQNIIEHTKHLDPEYPECGRNYLIMLYYVNDSDGCTKIYKEEQIIHEIEPKKGRVVIFPATTYHASSDPQDNPFRVTLNYNFF